MKRRNSIYFVLAGLIWSLFVFWTESYWLFLALPAIFDLTKSKKIPSIYKRLKGLSFVRGWVDWAEMLLLALLTAVFLKTFFFETFRIPSSSMEKTLLPGDVIIVSKITYGPLMPTTPLSFLFPRSKWSQVIRWPYHRLKGIRHVKRNDVVVFHFPEGDTVYADDPLRNYYADRSSKNSKIAYRPIDLRDNFIKRCVALPGDTIYINKGILYFNHKKEILPPDALLPFDVTIPGGVLADVIRPFLDQVSENRSVHSSHGLTVFLTQSQSDSLRVKFPDILMVQHVKNLDFEPSYFPRSPGFQWNDFWFGPLIIPRKGDSVRIDKENIPVYKRIITAYEGHSLDLRNDSVFVDGEYALYYTFQMNYYWVMGDNRTNSADSRFWGFVPEDHLVGYAWIILFSVDKQKKGFHRIRWNRIFMQIK